MTIMGYCLRSSQFSTQQVPAYTVYMDKHYYSLIFKYVVSKILCLILHTIINVFENILHKAIYNTSLIHNLRPIHLAQGFLTKLA